MEYLKRSALIFITTLTIGCSKSDSEITQQATCDVANTEFRQIFNYILTLPSNGEGIGFDREIHAYKFEVASARNICSIGYQSIPSMESIPYHIELYNNTTNTLLYSGDHIFSSTSVSYESIGSIPLSIGHSYTIKRVQSNWGSDISNTMGPVLEGLVGNYSFPLTIGALKITSSQFGNEEFNTMLPNLDIVFEE